MRIREAAAVVTLAALTAERPCCVYARRVLRLTYGADVVDREPVWRWHLVAERGAGPWEPVAAAIDARVGVGVDEPVGQGWHLVQGWRGPVEGEGADGRPLWPPRPGVSGHTFLLRVVHGELCEILDSTERSGSRMRWARWSALELEFRGGLAVAVLRRPSRGWPGIGK